MPLKNYGLLKGKVVDVRLGAGQNPHYQVRIVDDTTDYRIAINIQSQLFPSELEYAIVERFDHPILAIIEQVPVGFTEIRSRPNTGALDYIRGNLFRRSDMKPLPPNVPGPDNDLNEKIHSVMQRAMADEDSVIYAFGERWGPENNKKDKYFGFLPGNGIHDIHMNQSNVGRFARDNGVWQDGALMVHFPVRNEWIAVFLKFQSQGWHTDDTTGNKIGEEAEMAATLETASDPDMRISAGRMLHASIRDSARKHFLPTMEDPKQIVQIVAALVNSKSSPEVETVTIMNSSPGALSLDGWAILDTNKNKQQLDGEIKPGEARAIKMAKPVELSNQGGIITLVNDAGLKVDGVSYTREQAANPGWTIIF